ncbi:zinc-binding dehydrogenase [Streptomyces sp. NPDC050523]|uniref:zinc-binding dehydrogenase n=1 Tax=Streptomyces sp. NPDC050523 TaxID=3365622 RepID=UPI003795F294
MKALVAGATGYVGRHVVPDLKERGHAVRALVRDPDRLGPLRDTVDEVITADATDVHALAGCCALTPARVIALDVSEDKLRLATEVGAHEAVLSDAGAAAGVRTLTGGLGAEAVFDFVGAEPTVRTAGAVAAVEADVTIVGIGGGALPVGFGSLPFEVSVTAPYWGSRSEVIEVLGLARSGAVSVHTETYGLDEAPLAYERLHAGKINGRAVILPNG